MSLYARFNDGADPRVGMLLGWKGYGPRTDVEIMVGEQAASLQIANQMQIAVLPVITVVPIGIPEEAFARLVTETQKMGGLLELTQTGKIESEYAGRAGVFQDLPRSQPV